MRQHCPKLVFAILALSLGTPAVWGERLELDPKTTTISFSLEATAHTVHGTLALEAGEIDFALAGGDASGRIVIDARSARTGNTGRDEKMHQDVLESARYPQFVLQIRRLQGAIRPQGTSQATLEGDLEIHGVVKPVTLPATIVIAGGQVKATATLTIPFVAWGMKDPSMLFLRVAKEVVVTLSAEGRLISAGP